MVHNVKRLNIEKAAYEIISEFFLQVNSLKGPFTPRVNGNESDFSLEMDFIPILNRNCSDIFIDKILVNFWSKLAFVFAHGEYTLSIRHSTLTCMYSPFTTNSSPLMKSESSRGNAFSSSTWSRHNDFVNVLEYGSQDEQVLQHVSRIFWRSSNANPFIK